MTSRANRAELEICRLAEGWKAALRAKDVAGCTIGYAPDVVLFDVIGPPQHTGLAALRQRLADWFATFEGPVDCEIRDLQVTAGTDTAFCHSLHHFTGRRLDGSFLDMWVRFTTCLRRIDGSWAITHEHASAPLSSGNEAATPQPSQS
jgi:ketosteroid isomerase-like protein